MTRVLANYSDDRIRALVMEQITHNPGLDTGSELFWDICAEALTRGQADEIAVADAARQVADWLARAHVEGGA